MVRPVVLPAAPAVPVPRPPLAGDELPATWPLPPRPDPAFDRFTRLVRSGLEVPLSLVSLVSREGQAVPGASGLPAGQEDDRRHDLRHSICRTVLRAGRTVVHPDVRLVPELDGVPAPGLGIVAYLGTPLHDATGRVVGALCAMDTRPRDWADDEVAVLEELAAAASSELALRQLLQERRTVVRTLQEGLTDRVVSPPGLEVRVRSLPGLDGERAGGDWCDVVVGGDRGAAGAGPAGPVLVLGDVMGHDARASAVMGQLRVMARTTAWSFPEDGPSQVLGRVDRAMAGLGVTSMATCVVARVETVPGTRPGAPARHRLRWTSAGHPPPLLVRADGSAELLGQQPGVPLGVAPDVERTEAVVDLPPGATVLLYSDGLVERRDACLGARLRHLARAAGRRAGAPLAELVDAVVAEMLDDDAGRARDDVALLAVRAR
ncbi:PP2C family protein-serine/threonine phosphatase [uncultured Pseudokineococcus sp.]|uniref:PP2C family protein-serine/threonine phosphatase n=1 Tax=uncultured Pseudokineococcus sp. TaxID=1642928 RepID=UPI002604E84A|nr:GAF domain-containing SpoIIE family protein phosphatase [uncultured Pseudokineococcus sp.]